jgi:hypothetical protein
MRAAKEVPLNLDPVPDYFALAMLANGSHRLNRAFETVEYVACTGGFDDEGLVVFVATDFAICHGTPP